MHNYNLSEEAQRKKQLEKIAPVREKFLKLLQTAKKERVDHRTVKIVRS